VPRLVAVLLVACTPSTTRLTAPYQDFRYQVDRESYSLEIAGSPYEVPTDNCQGTRDSTKRDQLSRRFFATLQVDISKEIAAEIGGDVGVAKAVLGEKIGAALGIQLGTELEASSSVEIVTPPGKRSITTLQWKEVWTKGTVAVIRPDGSYLGALPFAALNSLTLEQLGSQTLDCETGETVIPESTPRIEVTTEIQPTPDCWTTVWSFNPSDQSSIGTSLSLGRPGFSSFFDTNVNAGAKGSLRIETTKIVVDPQGDPDAWSWRENLQKIEAKDGLYRIIAWIRTENVAQSHVSVVGRNAGKDVVVNGTNQISIVPVTALDGTSGWQRYSSREFNPKEWDPMVQTLVVGINAGLAMAWCRSRGGRGA